MLGVAWEVTEEVTEDGYVVPRRQLSFVLEKSFRVLSTSWLMNELAGVPSLPRAWLRCRCLVLVNFLVSSFYAASRSRSRFSAGVE